MQEVDKLEVTQRYKILAPNTKKIKKNLNMQLLYFGISTSMYFPKEKIYYVHT